MQMTEQTKTYKHPKTWWIAKPWTRLHNRYSWDIIKNGCFVTWKLETDSIEELLALWFLPEDQVMGEQEGEKENDCIENIIDELEAKWRAFWTLWKDKKEFREIVYRNVLSWNNLYSHEYDDVYDEIHTKFDGFKDYLIWYQLPWEVDKKFNEMIVGVLQILQNCKVLPKPTEGCNVSSVDIENIAQEIVAGIFQLRHTPNLTVNAMLRNTEEILKKHLGTSVSTPPSKIREETRNELLQEIIDDIYRKDWKNQKFNVDIIIERMLSKGLIAKWNKGVWCNPVWVVKDIIMKWIKENLEQLKTQQPSLPSDSVDNDTDTI